MSQIWFLALLLAATPAAKDYFAISVVDDETGRGVPLVELRTVDGTDYWTDSAGLVAFHQPGQMGQKVFFYVNSDGYEHAADGFGFRGQALVTTPGTQAELRVRRINIAERLYRVTGAGIYRDCMLLGRDVPIAEPLLNAQVTGSDSVLSVVFGGKLHWFWGDTNRPAYPLGTFHVPGATSLLPDEGGLDPNRGVNLQYFTRDDGFVAELAKMPGDGPTWIDGAAVIRETDGRERMFAKYVKVRKFLEVYERGLLEFDPAQNRFEKVVTFDFEAPLYPLGHAIEREVNGERYLYFGNPYPLVRVKASVAALADPRKYEAFTPLVAESSLDKGRIERDAAKRVRYAWKRNTPAPSNDSEQKWVRGGKLSADERLLALRDVDTGKMLNAHSGSVAYNAFRQRYVMIGQENGGTSFLGEVWYAEADTPTGPWVYARKIVTHAKYSFYNPRHHPMLDQDGGRRIYFEGTYSTFLTGIERPTPRYDYNQIMYALDLADPRLNLPVPVYAGTQLKTGHAAETLAAPIICMACDRPADGLLAVGYGKSPAAGLQVGGDAAAFESLAFFALPADAADPPPTTAPLYGWRDAGRNRWWYGVDGAAAPAGFQREPQPLCRVWRYPLAAEVRSP